MDRSYSSGTVATPPEAPASPSAGYPTAGNPATGTSATKPGPYWYHMLTEEVRNSLLENGVTPDSSNLGQLAKSISTQSTDSATRYRSAALSGCACLIEF